MRETFILLFIIATLQHLVAADRAVADIIVDDGAQGTSSTGTWAASGGASPYGSDSLWSRDGATYTWSASGVSGMYEVFMWWSGYPSRSSNVAVNIKTGSGVVTVSVNQQLNAGKWNSLGKYNFGSVASVTIIAAKGSTVSTCADAVKFSSVSTGSEAVLDNGGPGTSSTGTWSVSSSTGYYGANSVWSRDGSRYTWTFSPSQSGSYTVSMWWTVYPSRSAHVPVDIAYSGGSARVYVDQQQQGGQWNVLGTYLFSSGSAYSVTVTSQPGPSSTCADAVKFTYLAEGNVPPEAVIDSVSPNPVLPGGTVTFAGHGTDSDGAITAYSWRSDKDGFLSDNASFSTSALSTGVHTIYFKVEDDKNSWSDEKSFVLYRMRCDSPIRIMPLGDSITYGMGEVSDPTFIRGYRGPLHSSLLNAGYNVDFVGGIQTGDSVSPVFDIDHQGTPGITDDQTAANVFGYLTAAPPDLVLLHIGTNALDTSSSAVSTILDEIKRYNAEIPVVLARIINQKTPLSTVSTFNDNVEAMALQRIAQGDKIVLVDQEHALTYPDDMFDTLHPRNSGYDKMASVWFDSLRGILPLCGAFAPFIYTYPITTTTSGMAYSYPVGSNGEPKPTFSLSKSPPGMTISPTSGLITWTPANSGTFDATAVATNGTGSSVQNYSVSVISSDDVIIDNGERGTSSTGTWSFSSSSGYYGDNSIWSRDGSTYTWSFSPAVSRNYEVSLWWTVWPSRSSNMPVDISYSGGKTRSYINQQKNGGAWNALGTYFFEAGMKYNVTITSQPGPSSTCADAVRFQVR